MRGYYVEPYEPEVLAERYDLPGETVDRLSTLVDALSRVHMNSRPRIADALTGLELEEVRGARRMADLGTGMHCPGLVLAAVLPDTHVTLVEKNALRCHFLRRAASAMSLRNVEIVEASVPTWTDGYGSCDLVTSRAATTLETMLAWASPLLVHGGKCVLWVGIGHATDIEKLTATATELGLRHTKRHTTTIVEKRRRDLHVFEKTSAPAEAPAPGAVGLHKTAAIDVASLALEWHVGLDPAERDRFVELTRRDVAGDLTGDDRTELAQLSDSIGADRLLREIQRVVSDLRRRTR